MKPEELVAEKYLRKTYGENIIYEPCGKDTMPDFLVNDILAIEVRRLNQHFFEDGKAEGIEQLSYPLYRTFIKALTSFDASYEGKSFWVSIDYERSLKKEGKQVEADMKISLKKFLQSKYLLPCTLQVNDRIRFEIEDATSVIDGKVFMAAREMDLDEGDWVIPMYIENINHCIADKSAKIKKYKSKIKEWHLCLVDHIFGVDEKCAKEIQKGVSGRGEFDKVIVIDYTGSRLLFEID